MRHFGFFLLIASLMLTGCGGSNASNNPASGDSGAQPTDTITGTVTFKGAPLSGATVTTFLTNTNSIVNVTTTDASGNYTISGLQTSGNVHPDYQFWVTKPGYGFYPSVNGVGHVMRFDYTGQFMGNGVTDIAIYFTVVDYIALANTPLSGANFTAFDGSNPLVALARTGQSTSYSAGDDGQAHAGVVWPASRFTDNADGTITDHLTGLIWLRDAGCLTPALWSAAINSVNQLSTGHCGLSDGSTAGQWRMPNINELESLIDVSQHDPAVPVAHPFLNVSNGIYWSSTSYFGGQAGSPSAWTIRFSDGRYMNDTSSNIKATASNSVWAVKSASTSGAVKLPSTGMYVSYIAGDDGAAQAGVPLTYPRFIDHNDGTVTDTMTGLVWLKKADCIQQPWSLAVTAVNSLASGQCGLTDNSTSGQWRMPNRNELQSLSDRMENNHADWFNQIYMWKNNTLYQPAIFTNFMVSQYYWTSTTDAADTTKAWTVYSCDYGVYDISKASTGYTLAVR